LRHLLHLTNRIKNVSGSGFDCKIFRSNNSGIVTHATFCYLQEKKIYFDKKKQFPRRNTDL
jgi:hypothetical protein